MLEARKESKAEVESDEGEMRLEETVLELMGAPGGAREDGK